MRKIDKFGALERCVNDSLMRDKIVSKLDELVDSVNELNDVKNEMQQDLYGHLLSTPKQTKEPERKDRVAPEGCEDCNKLFGGPACRNAVCDISQQLRDGDDKEPECLQGFFCRRCGGTTFCYCAEKPAKKECKVDCKVDDKSVVRDKKECEPNDCGVFYHSKDELAETFKAQIEKRLWPTQFVPKVYEILADEASKYFKEKYGVNDEG